MSYGSPLDETLTGAPGNSPDATLSDAIEHLWEGLCRALPEGELGRVRGFLDNMSGRRSCLDELLPEQRAPLPWLFFPGLRSKPFHDPATFSWVATLEARVDDILEDLRSLDPDSFVPYGHSYDAPGVHRSGAVAGWRSYTLHEAFRPVPARLARCPRTAAALRGLPVTKEVAFSMLDAGARLPLHADEMNFTVTGHLGLWIPDGCGIQVGGETRTWQEGRFLVIDSSFLHTAWNTSAAPRLTLLFDTWHPDLTPVEIRALEVMRPHVEVLFGARESVTGTP